MIGLTKIVLLHTQPFCKVTHLYTVKDLLNLHN